MEGYMATSSPTNYFGDKTLAAVKKYQLSNSLPDTGFVGPLTRGKLNTEQPKGGISEQLESLLEQILNIQNLLNLMLKEGQ